MYPAALHRIPTQTVDSSQIFENWLLQKHPKMINKMTKSWARNTIGYLEQVCLKQAHDVFSWLLSSKTYLPTQLLLSWSVICLLRSISQIDTRRKRLNNFKRFNFVDGDNKLQFKNLTTLMAALSSYETIFPLRFPQWSVMWCPNG